MSKLQKYSGTKHPDTNVDYGRNWGDNQATGEVGYLAANELIQTSTWVITSNDKSDITLIAGTTKIDDTFKITSVFLSGGTAGIKYKLTNTINTYDAGSDEFRTLTKVGLLVCGE